MKRWLRGYVAFRRLPPAKRTLLGLTAACVAFAFVLIAAAIAAGDGIGLWIGLALLAGVAGGVLLMQAVDGLAHEVAAIGKRLDELASRLDRLDRMQTSVPERGESGGEMQNAAEADVPAGRADLSAITAATLERDRFPRLAAVVRRDGSEVTAGAPAEVSDAAPAGDPGGEPPGAESGSRRLAESVGQQNLLRRWEAATEAGDVRACRWVLSTMASTAELGMLDRMEGELCALEDRTEEALRRRFAECAARRDVHGALAVGREICTLLPERSVAKEFRRIEGRLMERAKSQGRTAVSRTSS